MCSNNNNNNNNKLPNIRELRECFKTAFSTAVGLIAGQHRNEEQSN
jgi:hypothetical protein